MNVEEVFNKIPACPTHRWLPDIDIDLFLPQSRESVTHQAEPGYSWQGWRFPPMLQRVLPLHFRYGMGRVLFATSDGAIASSARTNQGIFEEA